MAARATVADVREIGGLPDSGRLADSKITPHLNAAARELVRWIGDYSSVTGDDLADCKDAECALTMAYLIPVINVVCPEAIISIQKEYGELGMNFYDADDQEKIVAMWNSRAKTAVSTMLNAIPSSGGRAAIGWNVI